MFERNLINRHYKHSANPKPIWHLDRSVTTQVFEFTYICPNTGRVFKTKLHWKRDIDHNNIVSEPLYNHCSWRFFGYNPTPVTDWFRGLPKEQMFEWCKEHGLGDMKYFGQYTDFYFSDSCVYDSYNMMWVRRK